VQSAGEAEENHELDARIRKSLQARWPLPEAGALELEQACNIAARLVRKSSLHSQRNGRMREIALVGMILVMVVGGSWLTRQISTGSQAAPRPVFVTRIVQMVVTRTPAPTAVPIPTSPPLQSLLFNASQENIRQRMLLNRSLWQGAYIEAQFVRYGPPGYIGPPRVYRNQLWIQNPTGQMKERTLVLTGSAIEPSRAILTGDGDVFEVDLTTGLTYKSVSGEPQASPFFSLSQMFNMGNDKLFYSSILDGSALTHMLFSTFLADSESELNILYYDRMLDRDTLVIETKRNGKPLERYWVDADFGMVLRWQRFGGHAPVVTEEMAVTSLDFETKFPDQVLSPTFHWRSPLEWDVVRRDAIPGRNFANPLSLRPRLEMQEQPPSGFDPASNSLILQWSLTGRAGLVAGTSAEIYSDGYRLGLVKMGNPWNVVCKRSPDGRRIAFLEPAGVEQEIAYYAQYGPFWLDLEDPDAIHNALPNAELVGSDFAFSPDGQKLAFWGCGASPTNCGIYIHDLNSRKNLKLAAMDNGAIYIMWSPDGKQLGYFGSRAEESHRITFIVLDVEYGQILLESPTLAWPDNHIPLEAPQWARDALPGLGQTGLADCLRNMQL
jgi:hypothetical protein